jgi:hypothetical protein
MNCKVARRRLLSSLRPDQAPDDVQGHLSWCSDCQEWHGRLVHMEKGVSRIPVPRSHRHTKQAFLDSFLAGSASQPPTPPAPPTIHTAPDAPRATGDEFHNRRRAWIARLAAAAISGFGWWIVRL